VLSLTSFSQGHRNFKNLSPKLNNKTLSINHTIEDSNGYIWMAHSLGIEKYDGYNYYHIDIKNIFKYVESNDRIVSLKKGNNNTIWVISKNGLVAVCDNQDFFHEPVAFKGKTIHKISINKKGILFATKTGTIYSYNNDSLHKVTSIPNIQPNSSEIVTLIQTPNKDIYISTDKGKIYQYSISIKELSTLKGPFSDFPGNIHIILDKKNKMWIGTETLGLYSYDLEKRQFLQESIYKKPFYNIKKEMFISLFCDSEGFIWAGTDGGGLYYLNPNNGVIQLFTHHNTNKFSLSSNTILNINEDSNKNIWILTNYGGVNILPKRNNNITYHEGTENNSPAKILSIYKSKNGDLWAGTDGTGVTNIKTKKDGTHFEKQYFSNNNLKKGFYVQSIIEDHQSTIWIGTYKNGLWKYNKNRDLFEKFTIKNSSRHEATDVRTLYTDSKKRIWVASNLSLNLYSSNQILLASFENNTHGLKGSIGESIIEDENGTIWIGYYQGGLFKFNEESSNIKNSSFTQHSYFDEKKFKHDLLGIKFMELADSNNLWLISSNGKLLKYNTTTHTSHTYKEHEAFKNISITSVLKENEDNIWLSSTNGILHFNTKSSNITTYNDIDGLQDNQFLARSAFKDKQGMLYFGGVKGLNIINPIKMVKKTTPRAQLFFNAIEILNQPARSLLPDQITSGINNLQDIRLNSNQSSFSFRFSAINNVLNPNYHYAYRLLNFNHEWIPANKELLATYTNIPSGDYIFEVKAGSKKGAWDVPEKKLIIKIDQPFWNQPLAYVFYFLMLSFIVFGLRKWYLIRKKLIFEKINNKNEKELHALKMDFFAKMSHEIQTPLTLISGPIDNMLERAVKNGNLLLEQRLQIISNNVKRLSRIVFQLTTIRNKELEKIRLFVTKNNLFKELHNLSLSFKEQARFKNIDFTINCPKNLSEAWYDKDKFEHIIYNLLSNAFKFTPKEGNILLTVLPVNNKNSIKLSISDSGPGIPEEELNNIFTLFYQSTLGKQEKGTGIGLALTKELIALHRGKIDVISTPMEGTTFNIVLPITEEAYLEEEKAITYEKPIETKDIPTKKKSISTTQVTRHNKTILIVEDNIELQMFLKDLLLDSYNILLAENGEEGFHYAKNNLPDLILSDITMPIMDGIEMCQMLHKDHLTKHIPVILLTAKNSTKAKIQGLKSGAIEFINKPFNTNELLLKINNITTSTEHIISKFKKEIISNPEININKSHEDVFLENLYAIIKSKIGNPNFRMEELSEELHMSYSVLYRKCHTLTGKSLIDIVRMLRLKKAAIVIAKYGYSISESAYLSGFNDPKYFSKCFKKQFGKTPNTFKKEAAQMGSEEYLKKFQIDDSFSINK